MLYSLYIFTSSTGMIILLCHYRRVCLRVNSHVVNHTDAEQGKEIIISAYVCPSIQLAELVQGTMWMIVMRSYLLIFAVQVEHPWCINAASDGATSQRIEVSAIVIVRFGSSSWLRLHE
ncbi:hypothetical protein AcW1_008412 [Taiwanofungus camphoratus]|nr:hypothetical protein AcV5_008704 [Antrodia cinnamomea]KAI0951350.1 hypothetical protein AcW1_008412 [Antrodia cinnamomea]KAI0956257.1 hypothetical protein AcV7_006702 [Antrodia cinnamomea]